jgi:hypothetical protein
MVSIEVFRDAKLNDKYLDLCLFVCRQPHDYIYKPIYVHKIFLCQKSQLINTLYLNEEKNRNNGIGWSPVHSLEIILPNNITYEAFIAALNLLYELSIDNEIDIVEVIDALVFLSVSHRLILKVLKKNIPIDTKLTDKQIKVINHVIDLMDNDSKPSLDINKEQNTLNPLNPLSRFYGIELLDKASPDEEDALFGYDMSQSWIKQCYLRSSKLRFSQLPDYKPPIESQWTHLKQVPLNKSIKIESLGITWELERFIKSYGYDDNSDIIKLYIHENQNPNKIINIRVIFILYTESRRHKINIVHIDKLCTDKYKLNYMVKNYK